MRLREVTARRTSGLVACASERYSITTTMSNKKRGITGCQLRDLCKAGSKASRSFLFLRGLGNNLGRAEGLFIIQTDSIAGAVVFLEIEHLKREAWIS